ncbi:MAG: c-type cytochrome [Paracoccus sp. (in: a-proteobacteria)]|uniref:c-type cytochrome n=1 Tax=unclassified Paracoccus (in: a-proteobacteria) TaxID=2688777 RepID=UPI000C65F416|nr:MULTISPECIES: cytochrome C [unclassified Paracoccus (in: a-proteobacteria)]MBA49861.1 cytochrome C [Paracoccus sp. (in: a-proteobacteria)]MCS5602079.1 cytochrome C [Paracoccus sp. (in: a-proteobacteria)]MDB2551091.1 cytochrome C [Paracoccus sp. (in: a-proteobacteria)]|tara:strand:- start:708 stop:1127 length:420 start_codon:yes stop_codon:yes gene_type:complete
MKTTLIGAVLGAAIAFPAFAQDVANGEKEFRKCKACHMIQSPAGEDIVKGGKVGPNLYGVVGRAAGSVEGYKYSDALLELKDSGEVWTEADLAAYMTDPNKFVQEKTGDQSARTKMTFKLNKNQADVAAYLASVAPAAQ